MFDIRSTPTRPRQTIILAIGRSAPGLQCGFVKRVLVGHVHFQPFRSLAGIADCPHALVELTGYIFNQWLIIVNGDVFKHLVSKAELLGEFVNDRLIRQGFKYKFVVG